MTPAQSILSVSLEPARPGSAAQTHLLAIAQGLTSHGYRVSTVWRQEDAALAGVPGFALSLLRQVRHADLVYLRWHALDALTPTLSRLARRPLVTEVNGLPDDLLSNRPGLSRLGPLIRAVNRYALGQGTLLLCASAGVAARVREVTGADIPIVVVRSGAHPPSAGPEQAASSVPHRERPYVLYFGDLSTRQGLRHLLHARMSDDWPVGVDLVVAGDGPLRPLVQQHAVRGELDYLGRVAAAPLSGWIRGATATLSLQDPDLARNAVMGVPLKVVESLMLGTPVIASALSDVPDVVAGQPAGLLVDPRAEAEVCRAVRQSLLVTREVRTQIAERARHDLSWERAVEQTVAAIRSLPERQARSRTLR
ncbi:glycosyltransferase family 4 protein [Ornithinimicrobium ciconiae]|uniref:Glycosyltransferase family 4 protein n=1 Tax=Ornithinimicrobium ciconiae TaxID=2594265 RepID=A0A516GEZ8_9MICO|nr:glycosyltransferase family 4 protein [Ornithinimicrobium ciconiae]QDO90103.1 glycosyltransferase family 4 protein [Ornithinimicrobium ciconiae]